MASHNDTASPTFTAPVVIALVGVIALIVGVAVFTGDIVAHVDAVTLFVPLALLCLLPLLRVKGCKDLPFAPFGLFAALFLLWTLASMLAVVTVRLSFLTWARYASYFLLIPLVAILVSERRPRRIIYAVFCSAGVFLSLYGLIQYFAPARPGAAFASGAVSQRVFSTMIGPNILALALLCTITVTVVLFFDCRSKWRYGLIAAAALQIVILYLTYSRACLAAFIFGVLVAVFLVNWKAVIPAGLLCLGSLAVIPGVFTRLTHLFALDASNEGRLAIWRAAIKATLKRPIFGGGMIRVAQNELPLSAELYPGYFKNNAHNSYLQMFAETGIPGALFFIAALWSIIGLGLSLCRRIQDDFSLRLQAATLTGGLVAFLIGDLAEGAFQQPRAAVYFLIMTALLLGLGAGRWSQKRDYYSSSKILGWFIKS